MEKNNIYRIYSRWLAYALRQRGFKIAGTDINKYHPEFKVWLFFDSPRLQQSITELTHESNKDT